MICQLAGTIGYRQSEETIDTSIGRNYRCQLEECIDCQWKGLSIIVNHKRLPTSQMEETLSIY